MEKNRGVIVIKKLKNLIVSNKIPVLLLGTILLLSFVGYYFNLDIPITDYLKKEFSFLDFLQTDRKGTVNLFTLIFTIIICIAIFFAWLLGGKVGLWTSTIIWNFEILFYMLYSGRWDYFIEHFNIIFVLFLLFLQFPRDKRREEFEQLQIEYEDIQKQNKKQEKEFEKQNKKQEKEFEKENKKLQIEIANKISAKKYEESQESYQKLQSLYQAEFKRKNSGFDKREKALNDRKKKLDIKENNVNSQEKKIKMKVIN